MQPFLNNLFSDPAILRLPTILRLPLARLIARRRATVARDIYRCGPNAIRDRRTALNLTRILVEHGWLTPIEKHRADMHEWRIVRGSQQ